MAPLNLCTLSVCHSRAMPIRFHIEMPSAPYSIATLDVYFHCGYLGFFFLFSSYASAANSRQLRHYVFRSCIRLHVVCPMSFVSTDFAWCDNSVCNGGISMKVCTNILHLSGHCWKGVQGQRSKVKYVNTAISGAYILTVWRQVSLGFFSSCFTFMLTHMHAFHGAED